jgi:hypothetical protein
MSHVPNIQCTVILSQGRGYSGAHSGPSPHWPEEAWSSSTHDPLRRGKLTNSRSGSQTIPRSGPAMTSHRCVALAVTAVALGGCATAAPQRESTRPLRTPTSHASSSLRTRSSTTRILSSGTCSTAPTSEPRDSSTRAANSTGRATARARSASSPIASTRGSVRTSAHVRLSI